MGDLGKLKTKILAQFLGVCDNDCSVGEVSGSVSDDGGGVSGVGGDHGCYVLLQHSAGSTQLHMLCPDQMR